MQTTQTIDMSEVNREIAAVLNTHGIDAQFGIPDFILSKYMVQSLVPLVEAVDLVNLFTGGLFDDEFDD